MRESDFLVLLLVNRSGCLWPGAVRHQPKRIYTTEGYFSGVCSGNYTGNELKLCALLILGQNIHLHSKV